ncbi:MAG: ArnT family glycosyltransferase, partial [Thermoguttaceae bacterium]
SFSHLGISEFSARIPSVIWSIGSLLLVYQIALRLFGRNIALRTSLILGSSLMFCVEARAATPDAALLFWINAAMFFYIFGTFKIPDLPSQHYQDALNNHENALSSNQKTASSTDSQNVPFPVLRNADKFFPQSFPYVFGMYASMGVAVLAKGPIGFVLPTTVIGLFIIIISASTGERYKNQGSVIKKYLLYFRDTVIQMRPITAICVICLVAAPWYIAVGLKTDWEWVRVFIFKHNISRALGPMEGHAGIPLIFEFGAILFGTFPWSLFFIPTCLDVYRRLKKGSPYYTGLLFALCWCFIVLLIFGIAATKLPNYVAPLFTAISMIYAVFYYNWSRENELVGKFWTPLALAILVFIGLVGLIALPIASAIFLPGEYLLAVVGLVLFVGGGVSFYVWKNGTRKNLDRTLQIIFVMFLMTVFYWGAYRVSTHQQYVATFNKISEICKDDKPKYVSCVFHEPSWVFYSNGPVPTISEEDYEQLELFLTENPKTGFVIISVEDFDSEMQKRFPQLVEVTSFPYFLRNNGIKMLVLGNSLYYQR